MDKFAHHYDRVELIIWINLNFVFFLKKIIIKLSLDMLLIDYSISSYCCFCFCPQKKETQKTQISISTLLLEKSLRRIADYGGSALGSLFDKQKKRERVLHFFSCSPDLSKIDRISLSTEIYSTRSSFFSILQEKIFNLFYWFGALNSVGKPRFPRPPMEKHFPWI